MHPTMQRIQPTTRGGPAVLHPCDRGPTCTVAMAPPNTRTPGTSRKLGAPGNSARRRALWQPVHRDTWRQEDRRSLSRRFLLGEPENSARRRGALAACRWHREQVSKDH